MAPKRNLISPATTCLGRKNMVVILMVREESEIVQHVRVLLRGTVLSRATARLLMLARDFSFRGLREAGAEGCRWHQGTQGAGGVTHETMHPPLPIRFRSIISSRGWSTAHGIHELLLKLRPILINFRWRRCQLFMFVRGVYYSAYGDGQNTDCNMKCSGRQSFIPPTARSKNFAWTVSFSTNNNIAHPEMVCSWSVDSWIHSQRFPPPLSLRRNGGAWIEQHHQTDGPSPERVG